MKPKLGKYTLLSRLAQGGMAQVFLAEQSGLKGFTKKVVIKRMRPTNDGSGMAEMFFSEAVLTGQLNHPNLVHVYDFTEEQGEQFIVMEYVDGPSLKKLLKNAAARRVLLPIDHCLKIVSQVCEGLGYAHGQTDARTGEAMRLVHRDITPDNILFARNGTVKIADFGIVKANTQLHETRPGDVKGKLAYMAPEQLRSQPVDARADLFSLGAMMFEMLTGVGPFVRDNDAAVMDAIVHEEVKPLSGLRPEAPAALDAIIRRATSKRREERYVNALEMQEAVERQLFKITPGFGPSRMRELIETLDPSPVGHDDVTDPNAQALTAADLEDEGTEVGLVPEPKPGGEQSITGPVSVDIPITGVGPAPLPRQRSLLGPVLGAVALATVISVTGTFFVMRALTPAVAIVPVHDVEVRNAEPPPPPAKVEAPPAPEPEKSDLLPRKAPPPPPVVAKAPPPAPEPEPEEEPAAAPEPIAKTAPGEAPPAGHSLVSLQSTPEANVLVDGKAAGRTPVTVPLRFGAHKVRFENVDEGLNKSVSLRVPDEAEYSKAFVFEKARLFVMAPDGSTVYVGKKKAGRIPMPPIQLYEGTVTVRVVYTPTNLDVSRKLELKAGDRFEPFDSTN